VTHRQATLALVVTTLLWGLTFPALKSLFRDVSPLVAVGFRFGVSALLLAGTLRGARPREIQAGVVIGALFAAGVAFQNLGLEITTPSRSAFLVSLSAILTPAVGAVVLRHPVTPAVAGRLALAMAGVYLLTAPDGSLASVNRGDWLTMIAAVIYAGHIVAVGHYTVGSSIARVLSIKFATTSLVGLAGAAILETPRFHLRPVTVGILAFLIATSLVTFALQFRSQRVVSANEAALIFTFEPVVAAAASYVVFHERLSAVQMVGGLVILLAVGWPGRARRVDRQTSGQEDG
jgi:drug/metabolite transporter (DMT)-like permease